MSPLNVFAQKKGQAQKLSMISLYDAPTAKICAEAGVDALLVGDSMGNVVLGHDSTIPVTMEEMVGHTAAVVRGVKNSTRPNVPVVADLPFGSYPDFPTALKNSVRLMQVGACAVKLEGDFPEIVRGLKAHGVPVMGHIGFTPQSFYVLPRIVQGRDAATARRFMREAASLDEAGCFAIVLEAITSEVAAHITRSQQFATVGIGAGSDCDGQVLVFQDLVGLTPRQLRFVKRYAQTGELWQQAAAAFVGEVAAGHFPAAGNSWTMEPEEAEKLLGGTETEA